MKVFVRPWEGGGGGCRVYGLCMYRYDSHPLLLFLLLLPISTDLDGECINKCMYINTFLFDLYLIQYAPQ